MVRIWAAVKYFLHCFEKPEPLIAFCGFSNTCSAQWTSFCIFKSITTRAFDPSSILITPKQRGFSSFFLCVLCLWCNWGLLYLSDSTQKLYEAPPYCVIHHTYACSVHTHVLLHGLLLEENERHKLGLSVMHSWSLNNAREREGLHSFAYSETDSNWAIVSRICRVTFFWYGLDIRKLPANSKNVSMVALAENIAQWWGKCFSTVF